MTRWGVPLLVAATVLCVGGGVAAPASAAPTAASRTPVDRTITDDRLDENSGFAPSARRPGLLWTIEDSDNPARVYGVGPDGRTAATFALTNVQNTDWEAIAAVRGPDGGPWLAVGDIGDNQASRTEITVVLFPEPAARGASKGRARHVLHLRYPADDGPADAEALLADPRTNRLYLVTKGLLGGRLYAVPTTAWPKLAAPEQVDQPQVRLTQLTSVPLTLVTDGAVAPDGRLVLRTYQQLAVLPPAEQDTAGSAEILDSASLPGQEQGESVALLPGARQALVGSEGVDQPVYRVPVPGTPSTPSTPSPSPAAASAPARTTAGGASVIAGEVADAGAGQPADDQNDVVLSAALTAGGIGALIAAWFVLSHQFRLWNARRRRPEHHEVHVERVEHDGPADPAAPDHGEGDDRPRA